ncbi:T9SS type A sorting domain-containing protein [Hymenobacter antarcticus]|uniref:Secretion system C-terminal sorting domain-containing protein n=1 Tax=Hymenobacter antarcticus TaxID=486270 RepID=A0ABP7Q6I5_9BACT
MNRLSTAFLRGPRLLACALALLGPAYAGQAQTYNAGSALAYHGSLYHAGEFVNNPTGTFSNTGATITHAGAGLPTFRNDGSYVAIPDGSNQATDQFIGPAGAPGPQAIAGVAPPTFYNLALLNGAAQPFTVSNTAGINVTNLLTLGNGITTVTNTAANLTATPVRAIRITNPGPQASSLAGNTPSATTYVDGFLAKDGTAPFTYPLGATNSLGGNTTPVGANIYSPITVSSPRGTAIRYIAGATPTPTSRATQGGGLQLTNVSTHEYYPIGTIDVPAGATLTVPYGNFGPTAIGGPYVGDPGKLTIAAYNGTQWTNLSATPANAINTTAKTVTVTLPVALDPSYTALALASISPANPLPVELVSFTATLVGDDGLLRWRTASEKNSAYFEVQQSTDGRAAWQALGTVPAAGTSTAPRDYAYPDARISRYGAPLVYYRLRQVDLDGTTAFSPVVVLTPQPVVGLTLELWPNPTAAATQVRVTSAGAQPVEVEVYDATGRLLFRHTTEPRASLSLPSANWPNGAYLLRARQGPHTVTRRLVRE